MCVNCPGGKKKTEGGREERGVGLTPGTASPLGRALSSLTTASFVQLRRERFMFQLFFLSLRTEHQLRPPKTAKKRNFKVKRAENGTARGAETTGLNQINCSGSFSFFCYLVCACMCVCRRRGKLKAGLVFGVAPPSSLPSQDLIQRRKPRWPPIPCR